MRRQHRPNPARRVWQRTRRATTAVEPCDPKAMEDRLLDVNEASAMLGLKPCTLYQWAYERRVPVVKLFGRALRFKLSTIEKLIKDSERPALRSLHDRREND